METLFAVFTSLTGAAMLVASLVNAGKKFGIVKDGQAGAWTMILNLLAFGGLAWAQMTGRMEIVFQLDSKAGILANLLTVIVGYVYQLYVSRLTHQQVLAGLPLVGVSFSARKAGDGLIAEFIQNN
jgi:hypothetical protein